MGQARLLRPEVEKQVREGSRGHACPPPKHTVDLKDNIINLIAQ